MHARPRPFPKDIPIAEIVPNGSGWSIYPPGNSFPVGNYASYSDAIRVCHQNGWKVEDSPPQMLNAAATMCFLIGGAASGFVVGVVFGFLLSTFFLL